VPRVTLLSEHLQFAYLFVVHFGILSAARAILPLMTTINKQSMGNVDSSGKAS
jgi:hypothetical protein